MIALIVAMGKNRVIGLNNEMPWHMPADLAYFKKVTTGHPVVMGRKTFESIGRPLPNRKNIILTTDLSYEQSECIIAHSVEEALSYGKQETIFIIGGAQIYKQFLPFADKVYITKIDGEFEGDTFFPGLGEEWKLVSTEKHKKDDKNPYNYQFQVFSS